jgi:uncharacterized protein (TIGR03435 family)
MNTSGEKGPKHLALVVIHPEAVKPAAAVPSTDAVYDLYVPASLDDRADGEIQQDLRDAIINARVHDRALDRDAIDALIRVPRVRSVTVIKGQEQQTVGAFNAFLPMAFGLLLFMGAITGGQSLITSTVEEKSSRVIEVLLSAVSPMELMAGKLIGQLSVSLLTLSLYIAIGLAGAMSFSVFGLINPWLILYLVIFFLITYLVFGSLMMAIGAAVNDMREAQSMMMPIMMTLIIPWALWLPISRDPNSLMSTVLSFLPMMSGFTMMLRMASATPPPLWQVWLSIVVGAGTVVGALWFTAKVFRIGLLMYGKAPNFATLIRWARLATVTGAVVLILGNAPHIQAASPQAQEYRLAFDVISIKRSISKDRGGLTQTFPGRFVATNATLKMLFRPAYLVRDYEISGGPGWADTERYDIQATMGFAASRDEVHRMLQTLLAEQFKVKLHREPTEIPVYALVLSKDGVKFKAVQEGGNATGPKGNPNELSMLGLAQYLSRQPNVDRPVLDRTGLNGRYDVSALLAVKPRKGANPDNSVFTTIQDFGLKLESQKGIVDLLVIDHAEKPPEN